MKSRSRDKWKPRNRILGALRGEQRDRVRTRLHLVDIDLKQLFFDVGKPIANVYFVETCVASVVGIMKDGSAVETATIGNEGMVGLPLFHGVTRSASQAFCQVAGTAYRMSARDFRALVTDGQNRLSEMLGRYTEALFTMVAQSSACNRVHPMRLRCARWLLQTHDRVGESEFPLTHKFLAHMLGVRRATVTEAAGLLQKDGLIDYRMGIVRILNRRGLENASCECYAIIKSEFDRLLENRASRNPLASVKTAANGESIAKATKRRL